MIKSFLILSVSTSLFAGPPMLSNDPFVPKLGQFEINLSAGFEDKDSSITTAPIIDINYGLLPNLQITFAGAYIHCETQNGFDAIELAFKWNFYHNDFFAIAINPKYLSYPHDSIFNQGEVFEFSLPMSFTLSEKINWIVDTKYILPKEDEEHLEFGTYLRYSQIKHHYYLELFVENADDHEKHFVLANLGYMYQFHQNTAFMLSLGREVNAHDESATIAYSGLQFVF